MTDATQHESSRIGSRVRRRRPRRSAASLLTAAVAVLALTAAVLVASPGLPAQAATGCGLAANPVQCENALPGTDPSVWDITGAGDSDIQGFSTDISVNVGSTIGFKIDTTARAYSIQIFRTGYYQGLGARKIADVTPSASLPQNQPQCITNAATELYDCGNWAVSASWAVPADVASGVYVALLTRADNGNSSHITFIVRKDGNTSPVLFQTSDPTWQAYNTYGGSDFYQGAANGRAYKISYNRPVVTRGAYDGRDFYFSAEYAMVRFLEQNGYNTSYIAGVDTDRRGGELLKHKVFLSVGHDEYWSGAQRTNVENARDAGVNLQFLSGNEIYWRTRYEPSADASATPYRTLVSYKETWSNSKVDPSTQWTGTWRDPRFAAPSAGGGMPENGLSGTMYMSNFTDLAITVSAAEGKYRLWRNTPLSSLAAGSTAKLADHTIGYESDEDIDNGFRPAGLIRLSTTTGPVPQYLQDYGNVVDPGTTTHHLTLYRAPSGALVFSAGTIQWAWGLDAEHDGNPVPAADSRMRQAQVNLLADMGAQPSTLAAGLQLATASADTTPPAVTITSPAAGASIASGTAVTVTGTASDVGGVVAGVEVSTDGTSWHPATGTLNWSYSYVQRGTGSVPVRVRAMDDSGNYPSVPASRSVTVTGPFTIFGSETPAAPDEGDGAAVELGLRFTATQNGFISGVRFYKGVTNTGTHTGSLWSSDGVRLNSVVFTGESASGWQTATFPSYVPVTAGTSYVVSYTAASGHYAAQPEVFAYRGIPQGPMSVAGGFTAGPPGVYSAPGTFPTQSFLRSNYYVDAVFRPTDDSPLAATQRWPLPDSSSVPAGTTISAVLSKAVVPSSVGIAVVDQLGAPVAGSQSYNSTTRTAVFTPTQPLNGFVKYTATLTATDSNGGGVTAGGSWSFLTVKPPAAEGTCPCGLYTDATVPSLLEINDGQAVTLGTRFSSSVNGTITGLRFYKSPGNTGSHVGKLWTASGTELATVTFANETSSGWQSASFSTPVAVTAGTQYIVSYRSPLGVYSATSGAFSGAGITRGPLSGTQGAYSYGTGSPSSTSTASYLVDAIFERAPQAPSVVSSTPAAGAVGVAPGTPMSIVFSTAVKTGFAVALTGPGGPLGATSALSADGKTITITPTAALPAGATITVGLTGVVSTQNIPLGAQSWSFRVADPNEVFTSYMLLGNANPAVAAATDDPSAVELGLAFSSSTGGRVTAIRFYKGPGNTGVHTGSIWSSSGERLATVTFANETATGWQSATLSSPLDLAPGASYIVSYFAPNGRYSYTPADFAHAKANGPLTAAAGQNGRYFYGASGGMPLYSWNSTNYFVDVVFETPQNTTPTAPVSYSLHAADAAPPTPYWVDPDPVQLGVRFTTAQSGTATGLRYYRSASDTVAHEATLWGAAGEQLATVTIPARASAGWQAVALPSAVPLSTGVVYTASYATAAGGYPLTANGLQTAQTAGPLTSIANGGSYGYGGGYPTATSNHDFWMDVVFVPTP